MSTRPTLLNSLRTGVAGQRRPAAVTAGSGPSRLRLVALAAAAIALAGLLMISAAARAAEVRHFEKVSPDDKASSDIVGDAQTTIAAEDGDAVAFNARAQFAGAKGSGVAGQSDYVARRNEDGTWTTRAVTPMARPDAVQTFFTKTRADLFSADLRTAFISGYDLPEAAGAPDERMNFYLEDTDNGDLEPLILAGQGFLSPFDFISGTEIWGLSDDARHAAFETTSNLLPGMPAGNKVYQWDDGELSLGGILPDGTSTTSDVYPTNYRDTVSADGSRLAFRSPADASGQLYLRIDGETTHWVSQPEGSDQSTPTGIRLDGMTPDGKTVFFVTDSALLDEDTSPGTDLYRYVDSADPENDDNLTLITDDGTAVPSWRDDRGTVVGFSDDGEIVYVRTNSNAFAVWEQGSGLRTIASGVVANSLSSNSMSAIASQPGNGRVSANGDYVALLREFHTTDSVLAEMYVYNRVTDTFSCVSCPPGGGMSDATVVPSVTHGLRLYKLAIRPNFLSDDGQVFFSSAEALVSEDVNGVMDTYEYDAATGELSLLTTGRGSEPAMFADASRDGDDVFVVTAQQLVSSDTDSLVDLYDVRAGEGPPTPPVPASDACEGDECQGSPSSEPTAPSVGSGASGNGNLDGRKRASRLRVLRLKVTSRARATVVVRTSAAGVVAVRGRQIRGARRKVSKPGRHQLRVRLARRAERRLSAGRRVRAKSRVVFRPARGKRASRRVRLRFGPAKGERR